MDTRKTADIDKTALLAAIKTAGDFMAAKDVRHYLNGILLDFNTTNTFDLVATDGHCMFSAKVITDHNLEGQYIISCEDVKKLLKLYDKNDSEQILRISVENEYKDLLITDGKISYSITPVDGKFPNWKLAMPSESDRHTETLEACTVGVNLSYLAKVGKSLLNLANSEFKGVKMIVQDANTSVLFLPPVRDEFFATLSEVSACIMPMKLN